MLTQNLGYPRIGSQRQLKKTCEQYWAGKIELAELNKVARTIKEQNWQTQSDAITIETSRSQMELLHAFAHFEYPNEIGPGVYDIHSPRVPSTEEMVSLLAQNLWVNPDCGLKTRKWPETKATLINMVAAAKEARGKISLAGTEK